jgi:quinate dehydrogenase (quinone)
VLAVVLLVSFGWMFKSQPLVSASEAVPVKPVAAGEQQKNWAHWGNTTHGDRFAALDQINKQNVDQLQVAWVAHTGDIPQSNGSGAEDQNTPLQIGDTLYVCTPYSKVLALDVDSGKEKWRYDSKATAPNWQRCRGLGYYEESQAQVSPAADAQPAACSRRLFLPTTDARLIAIDADNGKLCDAFGDHGIVDLSVGMGKSKRVTTSRPPRRWWRVTWSWLAVAWRITSPPASPRASFAPMMFIPANWRGHGIRATRT